MTSSTSGPAITGDYVKARKPNFYYDNIKSMFNSELYSSVLSFSSWVFPLNQKNDILTDAQLCHVYILCGDAGYRLHDFYRAENFYRRSLQLYKPLIKASPHLKSKVQEDCGTSTDVKYKLYLCLIQCKKTSDALKILQSVPAKQRNVQINMALGNLFKQTGMERAAVTCYKEVLRTYPMALDAIEQLLLLGCNEDDIQSLIRDKTTKQMPQLDWYQSWIRGSAAVAAKDNFTGIKIFMEIREKWNLVGCVSLLHSLGVANTNYGDYAAATEAFKLAHHFEPMNMKGMDLYSFLLWHEDMGQELYKLMTRLNEMSLNETRSEPWVASAYYAISINRLSKAVIFAMRGSSYMGMKMPEGLIAKAHVFMKLKKYQEAVECFREVMSRNPERLEPHRGIVDCYMATARGREAMTVAIGAMKSVGQSPRVFNLCATALKKDPLTVSKAKAYLERALEIDNGFLPAIFNLVDIHESDGKYNEGIQLLKSYIDARVSPSKLHVRLAGLLSRNGMDDSAADQYAIALKLDPSNKEAREGLNRLDPTSVRANESSYELAGEDMDLEDEDEDEVNTDFGVISQADHGDSELDASIWEDFALTETR